MKRCTWSLTLLVTVLATFLLPSSAIAVKSRIWGNMASGDYSVTDPAGCITTSGFVSAIEHMSQDRPGSRTENSEAVVGIFQWNTCTSELLTCTYGSAPIPDDAFSMHGHLASATLNILVEAFDCRSGDTRIVSVEVNWNGEGDVSRQNVTSNLRYPGYYIVSRASSVSRDASLSGSLTFEGSTIALDGIAYGSLNVVSTGTLDSSQ
jgi:hypothetical protein